MISWIPFWQERDFNNALIGAGITQSPEFRCSPIRGHHCVYMFTLFMIVPIFNAMARIEVLIEALAMAAPVAGASSGTSWSRFPRRVSPWGRSSWSLW
jgi:ABC-type spermidine/putrescine transport system permease subunit I